MKKFLLLAVAGLISATASATNWIFASGNSGFTRYVDTDSISKSDNYTTVFIRTIYNSEQMDSMGAYNQKISFVRYDCSGIPRKNQLLSVAKYKDDTLIDSLPLMYDGQWNVVYPNTSGEETADIVCSYKK